MSSPFKQQVAAFWAAFPDLRISVEAVDIGRIHYGQAIERGGGLNMYALLTQLGVIPAPQPG